MNDLIPSAGCPVFAGEQVNLQLAGQPLKGAIFTNANLSGGTLEGANLSASVFHGTALTNVNLSGANLELATFKGANLNGVNLSNANLRNVDFEGTTPNTVDMSGATLTDANLNGTDLSTTTLTGVNQPVVSLCPNANDPQDLMPPGWVCQKKHIWGEGVNYANRNFAGEWFGFSSLPSTPSRFP